MPKRLEPKAIEGPIYTAWEADGHFHVPADAVDRDAGDRPYVIVIPPPNVTAVLHMGHGLNNTIQDVLIRWQRMTGRPTLWVPGTDHAGIATQNVVERQLRAEGQTRDDLGRDAFVERVWSFVDETGGRILDQLRAIGCSCDWTRTRFTLDDGLSRAVRTVFVELYERGLIYRGEYIINWCPRCLTALSNEEAEAEETEGRLYHLRYPFAPEDAARAEQAAAAGAGAVSRLEDGRWALTVSTTRPETMLGDTAVAVYPGDDRYRALAGARVELPLTGRTIPVVADEAVDPEFGTGMVKVTPAHDLNDFEIAQRTGAELLDVMTPDGHMNERVPEPFRGLDRFEARTRVVEALTAEGLFAGSEPHTHAVPHCYRCHTVVEPRLSEQWFVRMKPLAEPALAASRDGTITFTPERWQKVYEHWMENIRDWCISRQLWWGHRIPVWYCDDCAGMTVAVDAPTACEHCGSGALRQDPDVLDTWFSSWLWPFSTLGWPERTEDLRAFYPGSTLVTAPEILFFWVARMI
ncbi:MAG: valine--tRNA ligase, partial [Gemmatimonadetes bacterium]|nr:valine--tRNA ligase [Gemmatimonadota bacterium]